jgi:hypothetical protein
MASRSPEVMRGKDAYSGPFAHRAPDLIVMPAERHRTLRPHESVRIDRTHAINGKHTYEESSFFVRGTTSVRSLKDMKVENVLDVVMPKHINNR